MPLLAIVVAVLLLSAPSVAAQSTAPIVTASDYLPQGITRVAIDGGYRYDITDPKAPLAIPIGRFPARSLTTYTASCDVRAEPSVNSVELRVRWLNSSGVDVATTDLSLGYHDPTLSAVVTLPKEVRTVSASVTGQAARTSISWGEIELVLPRARGGDWVNVTSVRATIGDDNQAKAPEASSNSVAPSGGSFSRNLFTGFMPVAPPRLDTLADASPVTNIVLGAGAMPNAFASPLAGIDGSKPVWLSYWVSYSSHATPHGFPSPLILEFYARQANGDLKAVSIRDAQHVFEFNDSKLFPLRGQRFLYVIGPLEPPVGASHVRAVSAYQEQRIVPWMSVPMVSNWGRVAVDGVSLWQAPAGSKPGAWQPSPYATLLRSAQGSLPPFVAVAQTRLNTVSLFSERQRDANLFFVQDKAVPVLNIATGNLLPVTRRVDITATVFDWAGKQTDQAKRSVELKPFATAVADVAVAPPPAKGAYYVQLAAAEDGQPCAESFTRFAWLDRPAIPDAVRHSEEYPFDMHPTGIQADAEMNMDASDIDFQMRLLRLMGVRGIRLQSRYTGLDLANADRSAAAAREKVARWRADVLPVMKRYGIEGWVSFMEQSKGWAPHNAAELDAFRQYNYEQVKGFGSDVKFFLFGNEGLGGSSPDEPDARCATGWDGTTRQWMAAYTAAYEAAKAANPVCLFGPAHASDGDAHVAKMFQTILGASGKFDIWGFNGYGNTPEMARKIGDVLTADGYKTRFGVIPEVGLDVLPSGVARVSGEQQQADALVKTFLNVRARSPWVKRLDWFILQGGRGVENHYLFDSDWSPRPSAAAYIVLASTLGAGSIARTIDVPGGVLYVWKKIDGALVGVGWSESGKSLTLDTGRPAVDVADIFGNRVRTSTKGGLLSLTLGKYPQFVLGALTMEKSTAVDVAVRNATILSSGPSTVHVTITNNTSSPRHLALAPESGDAAVRVTPANLTLDIPAHQTKDADLNVTLQARDDRVRSTVGVSVADSAGMSFDVRYADTFARCVKASAGFVPDGTWAGWEKSDRLHADRASQVNEIGGVPWKGPADISATIRTMWDDVNFYVGVETRDDKFSATSSANAIFLNDALEIGFDLEHSLSPSSKLWQFGAGATPTGNAIYRFQPAPAIPVETDPKRLIVKQTGIDGNAVYQVAIPWIELGSFRPVAGRQIGFGIIVDDSDGQPHDRKFISWFGDGISSKHPWELGDLTFVNAGGAPEQDAASNLLANPSFEDISPTTKLPANWSGNLRYKDPKPAAVFSLAPDSYDGAHAVRIDGPTEPTGPDGLAEWTQAAPLIAGHRYVFSVACKSRTRSGWPCPVVEERGAQSGGSPYLAAHVAQVASTEPATGWRRYSVTFTAAPTSAWAGISLRLQSFHDPSPGYVEYDDASLVDITAGS
ncbi:MAG TPA: sugar-binding protein [Capsulimonadaceae bacterium]|jgi:hypothetical protein